MIEQCKNIEPMIEQCKNIEPMIEQCKNKKHYSIKTFIFSNTLVAQKPS